jgi:hypothetical protein
MPGKALRPALIVYSLLLQTYETPPVRAAGVLLHAKITACLHDKGLTPAPIAYLLLLQTCGNTTCEGDRGLTSVTQISSEDRVDGEALSSRAACPDPGF